jgi:hypothetical protein
MSHTVTIVGSGADAATVTTLDLDAREVVAINNAYSVPDRIDYHVYAGDWLSKLDHYPYINHGKLTLVSHKEYDGPKQHGRFGKQRVGIGATMFFNAAYWALGELQPDVMEFCGCSMHYPDGGANTFYGSGTADPLRFRKDMLVRWFDYFKGAADKYGCELVNLGTPDGLMPYKTREI